MGNSKITPKELRDVFYYKDGEIYWRVLKGRRTSGPVGCINSRGYKTVRVILNGRVHCLTAHRIIFAMSNNFWPDQVDHINGDRADNRIENLRKASCSQNCVNRNYIYSNKNKYRGYTYRESRGIYEVYVTTNNKNKYIGSYLTEEEAALAYNHAVRDIHGDFSVFNMVFEDMPMEIIDGEA